MKKFTLVLIALFVMGDIIHAQELLTGQNLTRQEITATKQLPKKAKAAPTPSKAISDADATTYMVVAGSYDMYGTFHRAPEEGTYSGYPMQVEMPADGASGDVTITGIYNFAQYADVAMTPITGKYDAEARTITIATPFDSESQNKCLKIGTYTREEESFTAVLAACKVDDEPDLSGEYPISIFDELVFDVAADGTLTPRTSWLIYSFGSMFNGIENIFMSSVGKPITDEAALMAMPTEVKFPDNTVYAGTRASTPLYIINYGRKSTPCTYQINKNDLLLAAYENVAALTVNEYAVMIETSEAGAFSGNITINYSGKNISIPVTANVLKAIDYNQIVKNGTFKFSFPESDYSTYNPWTINEEITGFPVALAQSKDHKSCGLNIEMEVPAGQTGVFSWKGISKTMQPNGFMVILDNNDILYNNIYDWSGYFDAHPADGYVTVPEGKHTLTFEYMTMMDWYEMGLIDEPQMAYIWDLDLQTYDNQDNLGVLIDETVDFGTWYLDKFISGASAQASILNLGRQPLRVTGGVDSESFSVTGIGTEVDNLETLKALIAFHGDQLGDYDETVTVKTTGGDFPVRCKAKAEKIINDYQYLVKEGDISFGTSVSHPFTADKANGIAYNSTAKAEQDSTDPDPDSWLSFSFVIPEGKQGTLSWEASNSSNGLFVFMDEEVFTDGTQLFIDGEKVAEFAGICSASSDEVDAPYLIFRPGTHCVMLNYYHQSSSSKGNDDRVVVKSVGLSMKDSGVDAVTGSKTLVSETWYTLDGRRVSAPAAGLYIRKARYSDGSVTATKVMKR